MEYCNNDPCDSEATHFYDVPATATRRAYRIYLCRTCAEAFSWGQIHSDLILHDLYELDEEEEENLEDPES